MTASRKIEVQLVGDSRSLERALGRATVGTTKFGHVLGGVLRAGAYAAAGGIAALGYGLVKAVSSAADFQQQLNVLQATSGATASQMERISALSIRLGKDIKLPATSAQDAAVAMTELAKAGITVVDSMAAARSALQLATAGELDVSTAAQIMGTSLNQFNLKGSQAAKVADLLAGAANASAGDVVDFAEGLKYAGTSAHAAGQSITMTVAALAEMANKGLQGSIAGSSLSQALRSLQAPSAKAAAEIKTLGLNIYDAHGNMKPLDEIAQVFTDHLGNMTQKTQNATLATIFGSRAVQAARIVFLGGKDALDKYAETVGKAGNAQRLTEARTKGFSGALAAFKSNVETLGIQLGLVLIPIATRATGALSGIVDVIGKVAGAKSPRIAIRIAWRGVGKLYDSLQSALFGETKRAHSNFAGHQAVEIPVRTKGLVGGMLAALKQVDWKKIGVAVAAGISAGLTFTAAQMNNLVKSLDAALLANSDQIANAGALLATKLVLTLIDPGFWADHLDLAIAIAVALAPTKFLKLGGVIGKALGSGLVKAIVEGLSRLPFIIRAPFLLLIHSATEWGRKLAINFALAGESILQRIPNIVQRAFTAAAKLGLVALRAIWTDIRQTGGDALKWIAERIQKSVVLRTLGWLAKVTAVLGVFNAIKSAVQWLIDHIPSIPDIPGLGGTGPLLSGSGHGGARGAPPSSTGGGGGSRSSVVLQPQFIFPNAVIVDGKSVKQAVTMIMPELRRQQARAG